MRASKRRKRAVQPRFNQRELHTAYARRICAEEAERSQIARNLHDDIGQRLAVLTMKLDALADSLSSVEPELKKRIQEVSSDAIDLARDVQSISRTLDAPGIEHLGLGPAASRFCRTVSEQLKVAIQFSTHDLPGDLPRDIGVCVFRVLQEAVRNAVTHSGARHIRATLRCTAGEIHLEVTDTGSGFDESARAGRSGLGLIIMRARVGLEGGQLAIESKAGAGTTVRARVPLHVSGDLTVRARTERRARTRTLPRDS